MLNLKSKKMLQNPPQKGERHNNAVSFALDGFRNGLCYDAIFSQIKHTCKFSNQEDNEIHGILKWAQTKCDSNYQKPSTQSTPSVPTKSPEKAASDFLRGFECSSKDVRKKSPLKIPESLLEQATLFLESLYHEDDNVNVLLEPQKIDGIIKPIGGGITQKRDKLISTIKRDYSSHSGNGAFFRFNPVKQIGTGKNGSYTDMDVLDFRYCLIESDKLPLRAQISLLAKLPLPICAITYSGGKSYHALVKISAKSSNEYDQVVREIYEELIPFGFDQANKNSSRFSRLPGFCRGDKNQKLIYLNPNPSQENIIK